MDNELNKKLHEVLHPEREWACPVCGCTEREPFIFKHYPFGREQGISQTIDFGNVISCCKQCRLIFGIPFKEA